MWEFNKKEQYIIGLLLLILFLLGGGIIYRYSQETKAAPRLEEREFPKAEKKLIVIHVCGAVKHPGVYRLDSGKRVIDAVEKAGGADEEGDLDKLNLAAVLKDGEKVLVPAIVQATTVEGKALSKQSLSSSNSLINLNTADAQALDSLPGIGPSLAERILAYRQEHGVFSTVEDLKKVSGIGEKKFLKLKELVTVN